MSSTLIHICTHTSSMLAFQIHGILSTCAPTHFDAAYYLSYLELTRFNIIPSFHQCNALIMPILTTLLQLKFQGATASPFETHHTTISVIVASSAINYLACTALLRCPLSPFAAASAHLCLVCAGYASIASLASLLFPDSARPYFYSIFVLISAAELVCYCKLVMREERDEEGAGFEACWRRMNRFLNYVTRVAANHNGRRPHILPV